MEINSKALDFFGGGDATTFLGGGTATDLFGKSSVNSEQQVAETIVTASRREINRIRGYKLQLTPAETAQLDAIQAEILKIQEKTQNGTVRPDELVDRTALYEEADLLIGKPVLDFDTDADDTYTEYVSALETLMLPTLDPAVQDRVDTLSRVKDNLEEKLSESPESATLLSRFQSVSGIIDELQPLRLVEQLSAEERALYDTTVELINDYTGVELQLSSVDAMRVTQLERTIEQFGGTV